MSAMPLSTQIRQIETVFTEAQAVALERPARPAFEAGEHVLIVTQTATKYPDPRHDVVHPDSCVHLPSCEIHYQFFHRPSATIGQGSQARTAWPW